MLLKEMISVYIVWQFSHFFLNMQWLVLVQSSGFSVADLEAFKATKAYKSDAVRVCVALDCFLKQYPHYSAVCLLAQ